MLVDILKKKIKINTWFLIIQMKIKSYEKDMMMFLINL